MGAIITKRGIARTYSHPSVADTYDIVEQYRQAVRYDAEAGSTRSARELELSRGCVRPWSDDAPPSIRRSVAERAIEYPKKATRRTQTLRAPSYFRELAALIESATGESVTDSDSGITISAAAGRKLGLA